MGGAVAKAARQLGLPRLCGIRRAGTSHPYIDQMHQPESSDSLLPLADFVVMAAPLTTGNQSAIGQTPPWSDEVRQRLHQYRARRVGGQITLSPPH